MNATRTCPQCQQPLRHDSPDGLCAECLMKVGLGSVPEPHGTIRVGEEMVRKRELPKAGLTKTMVDAIFNTFQALIEQNSTQFDYGTGGPMACTLANFHYALTTAMKDLQDEQQTHSVFSRLFRT